MENTVKHKQKKVYNKSEITNDEKFYLEPTIFVKPKSIWYLCGVIYFFLPKNNSPKCF